MSTVNISDRAKWLADENLQRLLSVLNADGHEARIAGGAIRNALLGDEVADIDIATTTLPDETEKRAVAAGFRTVPTGKEHGTVTVIAGSQPYEVTTLRADVETDGRHARVVFGTDWSMDAQRRDFTMNALYAKQDGTIVDLIGGLADVETRTLRFIGDAEARIREDYLRIMRFFRFFAWYGRGRPDADGIRACARLKKGLEQLSAERVWAELKKLLSAPDPSRALLWMRQSGVLSVVLPESEKWGIDAIHGLVTAEKDLGWTADPLLRLASIIAPDVVKTESMAQRLRMSKAETKRLLAWAQTAPINHALSELAITKMAYRGEVSGMKDRLSLALSSARSRAVSEHDALMEAAGFSRLLHILNGWQKPVFPLGGSDLVALGFTSGKQLGDVLKQLENEWVDRGFTEEHDALLHRAAQLKQGN